MGEHGTHCTWALKAHLHWLPAGKAQVVQDQRELEEPQSRPRHLSDGAAGKKGTEAGYVLPDFYGRLKQRSCGD